MGGKKKIKFFYTSDMIKCKSTYQKSNSQISALFMSGECGSSLKYQISEQKQTEDLNHVQFATAFYVKKVKVHRSKIKRRGTHNF